MRLQRHGRQVRMGAKGRAMLVAALLTLVSACVTGASDLPGRVIAPSPDVQATDAGLVAALRAAVEPLVQSYDGDAAVWIGLAGSRPAYEHASDRRLFPASLYKLGVMLEVERNVESGAWTYASPVEIRGEDTAEGSNILPGTVLTVDDALEAMITESENGTAWALLRMVGAESINATLARSGIEGFHVAGPGAEHAENVVSARALGTFFSLLSERRLLSAAASDRMLTRLARQTIRDRLPARLPNDARVAHKTGDLDDVTHDAGVIYTRRGPVVVVVLTEDFAKASAREFIANTAARVYETMR